MKSVVITDWFSLLYLVKIACPRKNSVPAQKKSVPAQK